MSLLNQITFERLLPQYERAFGGPPPFASATVEEAVAYMRDRLRNCDQGGNRTAVGVPGPAR